MGHVVQIKRSKMELMQAVLGGAAHVGGKEPGLLGRHGYKTTERALDIHETASGHLGSCSPRSRRVLDKVLKTS